MTCEISQAVIRTGIADTFSAPISAGIASSFFAPIRVGVAEDFSPEPTNVLAGHIGNGTVLLTWDKPISGSYIGYEVNVGLSISGTYFPYGISIVQNNIACIKNLPMTRSYYFRVRSIGIDQAFSDWVQAKLGIPQKNKVIMRMKAPRGSIIPAGSRFVMLDQCDRLAGFSADQDILFTG